MTHADIEAKALDSLREEAARRGITTDDCVCGHPEEEHAEGGGACTWAWNELPPPATGCPCEHFEAATCTTCGEPYTVPPTARSTLCSNAFHLCRDCTWSKGRRTKRCDRHATPEMEQAEILAASGARKESA